MPTVLSHPAAALALAGVLKRPTLLLVLLGVICTLVPDADVVAFSLQIPYGHPLGHRGFSHSLLFAGLVGALTAWLWRTATSSACSPLVLFGYFAAATASNGLLDALTNGGKGVGFFIPFDDGRYFFPWRPIEVSPIGLTGLFEHGGPVLLSEAQWVWLPALLIGLLGWSLSRAFRPASPSPADGQEEPSRR